MWAKLNTIFQLIKVKAEKNKFSKKVIIKLVKKLSKDNELRKYKS